MDSLFRRIVNAQLPIKHCPCVYQSLQNGALSVLGPRILLLVGCNNQSILGHLLIYELDQPFDGFGYWYSL